MLNVVLPLVLLYYCEEAMLNRNIRQNQYKHHCEFKQRPCISVQTWNRQTNMCVHCTLYKQTCVYTVHVCVHCTLYMSVYTALYKQTCVCTLHCTNKHVCTLCMSVYTVHSTCLCGGHIYNQCAFTIWVCYCLRVCFLLLHTGHQLSQRTPILLPPNCSSWCDEGLLTVHSRGTCCWRTSELRVQGIFDFWADC